VCVWIYTCVGNLKWDEMIVCELLCLYIYICVERIILEVYVYVCELYVNICVCRYIYIYTSWN
jgi:hypothetical protein